MIVFIYVSYKYLGLLGGMNRGHRLYPGQGKMMSLLAVLVVEMVVTFRSSSYQVITEG
jgi:hypothetical protein